MLTEAEAEILQRVIRPAKGDLSSEAAAELLKLDFTRADHARMTRLSEKAQEGTLSAAERAQLEGYVNVSHFIAFVQSKARSSLKKRQRRSRA